MDYLKKRQNDPEYLKTLVGQRNIVIEEEQRKNEELRKQNELLKKSYEELSKSVKGSQDTFKNEILNLNLAIKHLESEIEGLKHQKSQLQFALNNSKLKIQESSRQHNNEIEKIKIDFQSQKNTLNNKISNLQKNIFDLRKYYKLEEGIADDKKKIIEDVNRDLRGFSNYEQQRDIILQNQQLQNEIDYQSKNIMIQLQKTEKLQQQIKSLKIQVDLHKQIQNDLVKRSSLAQSLIKKLTKQIQQLRNQQALSQKSSQVSSVAKVSQQSSRVISQVSNKQLFDAHNKLKFEHANLKNYNHYLENMQNIYSKKYETLGSIMSDYLEHLLYFKEKNHNESGLEGAPNEIVLNISNLKKKDVKEWKVQETEAVIHLLIAQVKPYLSKNSLIHFPEVKNINISFIEEQSKEPISLPKIVGDYEKSYDKEIKKSNNRFKDIPIDISTKILRSNLREWGTKIKYGNLPITKTKSKSNAEDVDRTVI